MFQKIKIALDVICYTTTIVIVLITIFNVWPSLVNVYLKHKFAQELAVIKDDKTTVNATSNEPQQTYRPVTVKIGDGAFPEVFSVIGQLKNTDFVISSPHASDFSNPIDKKSVTISGEILFNDVDSETIFQEVVSNSRLKNYELLFDDGTQFTGMFKVVTYGRYGKLANSRVTLNSVGNVEYTQYDATR